MLWWGCCGGERECCVGKRGWCGGGGAHPIPSYDDGGGLIHGGLTHAEGNGSLYSTH